jgi:hypothetical protein
MKFSVPATSACAGAQPILTERVLLRPAIFARIGLLVFMLGTAGCDFLSTPELPTPVTVGVAVGNQGLFGEDNGSVTIYDPATGNAVEAISGIGSIIQSLQLVDDRLYVMANTADRVNVYDRTTLEPLGTIDDIRSPRYMVPFTSSVAYVTNLTGPGGDFAGGSITRVNLHTMTAEGEVEVGPNPEGMTIILNRVFVANHGFGSGRTVTVLSAQTGLVLDEIDIGCDGPRFVTTDLHANVWVLCTGRTLYDEQWNETGHTPGAIRVLDGNSGEIIFSRDFEEQIGTGFGHDGFYVPENEELYVVYDRNRILRINVLNGEVADELGPFEGDPIGAVAYDVLEGRLYIARVPADFTVSGKVTIHRRNGEKVGEFTAGIAPTYIGFLREVR